jgi:hypothetical protein
MMNYVYVAGVDLSCSHQFHSELDYNIDDLNYDVSFLILNCI